MRAPRWIAVACYIAWLAMWGDISVPNLLSGFVVVGAALWVSSSLPVSAVRHRLHLVALVRLCWHFVRLLVLSNWTLIKTTLRPTPAALRSAIVAAPLSERSPLVASIVANFISLTPGTLSLDVRLDEADGAELYLHVLGFGDVDAVRADVAQVERWVLAAVTPQVPVDSAAAITDGGVAR
jgi:multicomponent Na+:H+ antiporter subunit E